jgi:hypothetical protein
MELLKEGSSSLQRAKSLDNQTGRQGRSQKQDSTMSFPKK